MFVEVSHCRRPCRRAVLFFSDSIFGFMVAPLRQNLKPGQSLIGTGVTEAFLSRLKSLWRGAFFSLVPLSFIRSGGLLRRVYRAKRKNGFCRLFFVQRYFFLADRISATGLFFPLRFNISLSNTEPWE